MDNIQKYYLMPHPTLIIPTVGNGKEKLAQRTIDACNQIGEEIKNLEPETIIIITPHGTMFSDVLSISDEEDIKGDFRQFKDNETVIEAKIDKEFNEQLLSMCKLKNMPAAGINSDMLKKFNRKYKLDYGSMVPLYFINKFYNDYKIVHITYTELGDIELYKFGMLIKQVSKNLKRKTVLIASGDLSHKLSESSNGYSLEGKEFDKNTIENLQKGDVLSLFNMDRHLIEDAAQCGLKSIYIMLGAMEGEQISGKLISYESPYGVGYGVMSFNNELKSNISNLELLIENKKSTLNKKVSNSNIYVKLARESLNHYYSSGHLMAVPRDLPKEILKEKSGVFISLKKFGELRGCIGTFLPTTDSIAQEIIKNSVEAATHDKRFPRVSEDELLDIDISVDILDRPHKATKEQLDPKEYGVIVIQGYKKGLILPDIEGINTVKQQLDLACKKGNINVQEEYKIEKFKVKRYDEQ